MKTVRTTILLDADLLDRLDRHVQRQRTTKTSVIAAAIETWLDSHEAAPGLPVRRHRPQHARAPVAGRAVHRAPGGGPAARRALGGVLLDPSAVLAAADAADLNHRAAVAWFGRVDEPVLLGALGLAELDVLLQRELGAGAIAGARRFAASSGSIRLVAPTRADLVRAVELMTEAAEHRPRLADALLVATAERLGIRRVAAFDRRPLAVFRPRHVRNLDFEP